MASLNGWRRLSWTIVALTAVGGVAAWPRLPEEMAIHFTAGGSPDNFVPRAVGILLMPAVMVLTMGILRAGMRLDPPENHRVPQVVAVSTLAFMGVLHGLVLAWNLGYPVPFEYVLIGTLGWAIAMLGYALKADPPW
ncbi:DUF1648 domain-containing protein [Halorhabdus sp. CBA1104]|uniref:DUF1648 domain-containing protein n=1 Tax=unclassified Halorhabdus TaxID=2621901 RepID=UPI0012B27383|nr:MULTISPECIES: DUF1648 domain-containing protein [unclassified Halorhabdus]QGN06652.1 DUF1648 domain-containing protein [Halorhabdus sp. CBA1104]